MIWHLSYKARPYCPWERRLLNIHDFLSRMRRMTPKERAEAIRYRRFA